MCGGKVKTQEVTLPPQEPLPDPTPMPSPSQSAPVPAETESSRAERAKQLKKGVLSTVKSPRERQQAAPALVSQGATMYGGGDKKTLG